MSYNHKEDNVATIIATLFVAAGLGLGFANGYGKDLEVVKKQKDIMEVKHDAEVEYWRQENARQDGYIKGLLTRPNGNRDN